MDKKQRNLIITIVALVVVIVAAYFIYQAVSKKAGETAGGYVVQLALPPTEPMAATAAIEEALQTPNTQPAEAIPPASVDAALDDVVKTLEQEHSDLPPQEAIPASVEPETVQESEPVVPDLPMLRLDGTQTTFDAQRDGKPSVINFWATWCPPCKAEIPSFEKAYEQYGDQVEFFMMSVPNGYNETQEKVREFVLANKMVAPVYFDDPGYFSYIFGVTAFPSTVFINADGTPFGGHIGFISENQLMQSLQLLIQNNSDPI